MAQSMPGFPLPGTQLSLSEPFRPALLAGMAIDPDHPLSFEFIVDAADAASDDSAHTVQEHPSDEYLKLIKYFFAALTVPEDQMWVNLSPAEPDRIIAQGLGQTEMGRDMLAQDYLLKQLTASLMSPEGEHGKTFWDAVYSKAYEQLSTGDSPGDVPLQEAIESFNKIWIVADRASVYVHENRVFVTGSHLKVMLEEDYLAASVQRLADSQNQKINPSPYSLTANRSDIKDILRSTILPIIEEEINTGKTFANLRQIYNSMILAVWYKKNLKSSLLTQVYVDQNKVEGIEMDSAANGSATIQDIYNQYLAAFTSGVDDVIHEEYDPQTQSVVPRKYFTGGLIGVHQDGVVANAMLDTAVFKGRTFVNVNVAAVNPAIKEDNNAMLTVFRDKPTDSLRDRRLIKDPLLFWRNASISFYILSTLFWVCIPIETFKAQPLFSSILIVMLHMSFVGFLILQRKLREQKVARLWDASEAKKDLDKIFSMNSASDAPAMEKLIRNIEERKKEKKEMVFDGHRKVFLSWVDEVALGFELYVLFFAQLRYESILAESRGEDAVTWGLPRKDFSELRDKIQGATKMADRKMYQGQLAGLLLKLEYEIKKYVDIYALITSSTGDTLSYVFNLDNTGRMRAELQRLVDETTFSGLPQRIKQSWDIFNEFRIFLLENIENTNMGFSYNSDKESLRIQKKQTREFKQLSSHAKNMQGWVTDVVAHHKDRDKKFSAAANIVMIRLDVSNFKRLMKDIKRNPHFKGRIDLKVEDIQEFESYAAGLSIDNVPPFPAALNRLFEQISRLDYEIQSEIEAVERRLALSLKGELRVLWNGFLAQEGEEEAKKQRGIFKNAFSDWAMMDDVNKDQESKKVDQHQAEGPNNAMLDIWKEHSNDIVAFVSFSVLANGIVHFGFPQVLADVPWWGILIASLVLSAVFAYGVNRGHKTFEILNAWKDSKARFDLDALLRAREHERLARIEQILDRIEVRVKDLQQQITSAQKAQSEVLLVMENEPVELARRRLAFDVYALARAFFFQNQYSQDQKTRISGIHPQEWDANFKSLEENANGAHEGALGHAIDRFSVQITQQESFLAFAQQALKGFQAAVSEAWTRSFKDELKDLDDAINAFKDNDLDANKKHHRLYYGHLMERLDAHLNATDDEYKSLKKEWMEKTEYQIQKVNPLVQHVGYIQSWLNEIIKQREYAKDQWREADRNTSVLVTKFRPVLRNGKPDLEMYTTREDQSGPYKERARQAERDAETARSNVKDSLVRLNEVLAEVQRDSYWSDQDVESFVAAVKRLTVKEAEDAKKNYQRLLSGVTTLEKDLQETIEILRINLLGRRQQELKRQKSEVEASTEEILDLQQRLPVKLEFTLPFTDAAMMTALNDRIDQAFRIFAENDKFNQFNDQSLKENLKKDPYIFEGYRLSDLVSEKKITTPEQMAELIREFYPEGKACEFIKAVDEDGRDIGIGYLFHAHPVKDPRSVAAQREMMEQTGRRVFGYESVTAFIVLIDEDGRKFLFSDVRSSRIFDGGKIGSATGGHVGPKGDPDIFMIREVLEETGADVRALNMIKLDKKKRDFQNGFAFVSNAAIILDQIQSQKFLEQVKAKGIQYFKIDTEEELKSYLPDHISKISGKTWKEMETVVTGDRTETLEIAYGILAPLEVMTGFYASLSNPDQYFSYGKNNFLGDANLMQKLGEVIAGSDKAMMNKDLKIQDGIFNPGGIDFDAKKLDLDEQGSRMQFNIPEKNFDPAQLQNIQGFRPVIRSITPIIDIRPLFGLAVDPDETDDTVGIPKEFLGRERSRV